MATIPSWFVILMGMSIVFIGLICIVLICKLMGLFFSKKQSATPQAAKNTEIRSSFQNRDEVIAVIGTAIAEETGVDVNAIRIKSIKKIEVKNEKV